jgi:hypothetical protein
VFNHDNADTEPGDEIDLERPQDGRAMAPSDDLVDSPPGLGHDAKAQERREDPGRKEKGMIRRGRKG